MNIQTIQKTIKDISLAISQINTLDITEDDFLVFSEAWHQLNHAVKKMSYVSNPKNQNNLHNFEYKWTTQSIQFIVDILPNIHEVLLKYYKRKDELELIDIGAGSGAGANLIAQLHKENMIYSKINVTAIDYIDTRMRWAMTQYPLINYQVTDLYHLDSKKWDISICSHCLEHVPNPRAFVAELVRITKDFVFIYTPYDEKNPIQDHINIITEEFYQDFNIERIKIFNSMA